jgi:hypothetical protein
MTDHTLKLRPLRRFIGLMALAGALAGCGKRADLPPRYEPTPENEAARAQLTDGAMTFVLLHETGHMLIHRYHLPIIASEEDEADHFAAAALAGALDPGTPSRAQAQAGELAMSGAASYFDHMHRDNVAHNLQPAWSDEHGEPAQRAFNLLCLLYGGSPPKYAHMARFSGLPSQRIEACPGEAKENKEAWAKFVLDAYHNDHLSRVVESDFSTPSPANMMLQVMRPQAAAPLVTVPGSRKVGVFYNPVPDNLDPAARAKLLRGEQIARSGHAISEAVDVMRQAPMPWMLYDPRHAGETYAYRLVGDPCLKGAHPDSNAQWDGSTRTITYCYGLVADLDDNSRDVVAQLAESIKKAPRRPV